MPPHFLSNPPLTLSALQFASPTYLFALAAIALPVLAHLNRRKNRTTIIFPAVRFLKQSIAARKKSTRLRDLLLLLIRIAVIALIVLAFAQPIYRSGPSIAIAPPSDQPAYNRKLITIIIDASASMQRIDRGISLFDRAKLTADNLLTQISRNDNPSPTAIIIATGPHPRSLLPRFTNNISALRDLLRKQTPSFTRANINQSIHLAASLPPQSLPPSSNRHAVIITDTQATEWSSISPQTINNLFADFTILPVTPANPIPNIALRNLTITPPNPVAGDSITISVSTYYDIPSPPVSPPVFPPISPPVSLPPANSPPQFPVTNFNMKFTAGPYTINHAVENLQPGESRLASMRFNFHKPQTSPVTITITPNDNFTADNEISTALRIRAKRRVLILTSLPNNSSSIPSPEQMPSSVTLLAAALQPSDQSPVIVSTRYFTNDQSSSISSIIQPINTSQLLKLFQTPQRPDIIALCAIDKLSETSLATLDRLTRAGTSLLWFLDSPQSLNNWNRLEQLHHTQNNQTNPPTQKIPLPENAVLPFIPQNSRLINSSPANITTLTTTDNPDFPFDDPLWSALFQIPFTPSALGSTSTTGQTLLQFSDNKPALITGRLENGRILLFNASISLEKTPLAKQPIFIPFTHEIIRYLMPTRNPFPQSEVGSPIIIPLITSPTSNPPLLKNLTIKPDWAQQQCQLTNQTQQNIITNPPAWSARFDNPISPTLIRISDKKTNTLLAAAGIHINKSESQMRPLSNPELKQYIHQQTSTQPEHTNQPQQSPTPKYTPFTINTAENSSTRLWPTLLLLALLLAITENIIQLTTLASDNPLQR